MSRWKGGPTGAAGSFGYSTYCCACGVGYAAYCVWEGELAFA